MSNHRDLVVKTGEYTNNQGETKARYENIGKLMKNDKGVYIILKRTFNPAGVPNPDNSDAVFVSVFEPRDRAPQQMQSAPQQNTDFDSDIPF